MGYGFAGALAAWAMDRLAWLGQNTAALRPAWTLLHVLILAWGADAAGASASVAGMPVVRSGRRCVLWWHALTVRHGHGLGAVALWFALYRSADCGPERQLRGALCMVLSVGGFG
jgi:hypothetical protein